MALMKNDAEVGTGGEITYTAASSETTGMFDTGQRDPYVEWHWTSDELVSLRDLPIDQVIRSDRDVRVTLWQNADGVTHLRIGADRP
jgi:hypothetical protein